MAIETPFLETILGYKGYDESIWVMRVFTGYYCIFGCAYDFTPIEESLEVSGVFNVKFPGVSAAGV